MKSFKHQKIFFSFLFLVLLLNFISASEYGYDSIKLTSSGTTGTGTTIIINGSSNHNDLQNLQGGSSTERYHMSAAQYSNLGSTYNATYAANMANNSFNQTFTDALYANIKWGYNMTTPFTDWLATFAYDYNQTTPAIASSNAYTDSVLNANNATWSSTYNSTYDNYVIANISNKTYNWQTSNNGTLNGINTSQMDNSEGVLNILQSWFTSTGNILWCTLTGCNMTGDLNMNGNKIRNVTSINPVGTTLSLGGTINITGNLIVAGNMSVKRPYWNGYDNSTQNFLNTANTQVINISNNNDYDNYLINIVGNQNITFSQTGDYLCILSPEFTNTATTATIGFWYQKNGVDVAWSNSRYTITNGQYLAPAIPFQFDIANPATDNIRFMWSSTSTNTQIVSIAELTSPTRPGVPGVILNCQKVSEIT
jgi:hypothetical protein